MQLNVKHLVKQIGKYDERKNVWERKRNQCRLIGAGRLIFHNTAASSLLSWLTGQGVRANGTFNISGFSK